MSEDVTSNRFKNQMSLCLANLRVLLVGCLGFHTIYCLSVLIPSQTMDQIELKLFQHLPTLPKIFTSRKIRTILLQCEPLQPPLIKPGFLSTSLLHVCHCLPFPRSKFGSKNQQKSQAQTNNSTSQRGGFESRFAHTQTVKGTVDLGPSGGAIHFKREQVEKDHEDFCCVSFPKSLSLFQPHLIRKTSRSQKSKISAAEDQLLPNDPSSCAVP